MTYNRITAEIGESRRITTRPISYQYDTVQILMLTAAEGIELPEFYQVDFCVIGDEDTVTMVGSLSGGAPIPDSLLRQGENLMAYLVLTGTESDVQTRYEITIPVNERPTRSGIELTDEQQAQVDSLVEALNEGVDRAEAEAEAIQNMGVEAETLAAGSEASVEKAVDPETGAVTLTFGIPKGTHGDPGYSPTIQIATITGGHRITVTDSQGSANFDVMDGEQGDPGAPGDDGYSPAVTITQITNGHRVTITDKTHQRGQTFDVMDGEQGDPGTPGDDGYSPAVTITTITGGHRVTITDKTHPSGQTFDVMDGVIQSVNGKSAASITLDSGDIEFDDSVTYAAGSIGAAVSDAKNAIDQKQDAPSSAGTAGQVLGLDSNLDPVWVNQSSGGDVSNCAPIIINSASGDIASFADGADNRQIRKIVGTIVPMQSGTGDPSPDNVRPISGWTGANITRAGKNLWNKDADFGMVDCYNYQGTAFSRRGIIYHLPAGTYALSASRKPDAQGAYINANIINADNSLGEYLSIVNSDTIYNRSIIIGNGQHLVIYDQQAKTASEAVKFGYYDIQLEIGSTITAFEAYKSQTIPINWQSEAGTIYGGTVTLNEDGSADVVSDWRLYDLASLSWTKDTATSFQYYYASTPTEYDGGYVICSCYNPVQNGRGLGVWRSDNIPDLSVGMIGKTTIGIKNHSISTAADFAQSVIGQSVLICDPIKTSYHFDNIGELYTYFGTNNVWIDTGSITECDYPADTKLYIDGLTEPDEDMIANANIASGKYFVVNNQLYLSTAAIAAGSSIVPGTNCTATNLADALNALNT